MAGLAPACACGKDPPPFEGYISNVSGGIKLISRQPWTHFLAASCETVPPPTPMTASMPIRLFILDYRWWWLQRARSDGLLDSAALRPLRAADRGPKRKSAQNASSLYLAASLHAVTLRDCHTVTVLSKGWESDHVLR